MNTRYPTIPPLSALPKRISEAVASISCITQAPNDMIMSAVLSGASLATQSGYNIERRTHLFSPLSLYFLSLASSGERKTTVDKLVFKAFNNFFENGRDVGAKKGKRLVYSDVTPYAFVRALSENSISAALIDDEASRFFQGKLIEDLGLLNSLWSSSPIHLDRKQENITIHDARCTISLMIQPGIFCDILKKKGKKMKDIGFFARFLFCNPMTNQGYRLINDYPVNSSGHQNYCERITDLLEEQIDFISPGSQELPRPRKKIFFDKHAQKYWNEIYNFIEHNIGEGGIYFEHPEYASKMAENIARLAGIFHVFEGEDGLEVSEKNLNAAYEVICWYASEYMRIFHVPNFNDQIVKDAELLYQFLYRTFSKFNCSFVQKNYLLQYGPNSLRKVERLDVVLTYLIQSGYIGYNHAQTPNNNGRISRNAMIYLLQQPMPQYDYIQNL